MFLWRLSLWQNVKGMAVIDIHNGLGQGTKPISVRLIISHLGPQRYQYARGKGHLLITACDTSSLLSKNLALITVC